MRKQFYTALFGVLIAVLMFACNNQRMPLPVEKSDLASFGANDTSYIEVQPLWDSQLLGVQLQEPADIIIGPDGYIWLANTGGNRVLCLRKSAEIIQENGFDQIRVHAPQALALDSKLNLFIANGTDSIYMWNEYFHIAGVEEVAFKAIMKNVNGDTVHLPIDLALAADPDSMEFDSYLFTQSQEDLAKVLDVGLFYVAQKNTARIYGVAAGTFGSEELYFSDAFNHRISRVKLVPWARVRLKNHGEVFAYKGKFDKHVVSYGSGAGTVDTPRQLYVDRNGNLYLTQWGGNFLVQKLKAGTFLSVFELHKHPIMDLNRFGQPCDITLDDDGNLFVVDRLLQKVFKFDNLEPGAGKEMKLGKKGLATAEFIEPVAIMVSDNVVYVVDVGANSIRRFKLSISEGDIPVEPGSHEP